MMKLRRSTTQIQRISPRFRMVLFGSGLFIAALTAVFLYSNFGTSENAEAGTQERTTRIVSEPNTILNECEPLTSDAIAGATQIRVLNNSINYYNRFSNSLDAGSLILIVQMQVNDENAGNQVMTNGNSVEAGSGKYEFAEVSGIEKGSRINLTAPLKNSYSVSGKTQVVRIPRYINLTIQSGGSVTADPWDGTTGGIVAVEAEGKIVLQGSINVSGKGFFGGIPEQKTGISLLPAASNESVSNTSEHFNRIFAGSGGSKGINGGGIVYLLANGTIEGNGRIEANGDSVSAIQRQPGKRAGGSGGTIFIYSPNAPVNGITLSVNGGKGSAPESSTTKESTGGRGGKGGFIRTTIAGTAVCIAESGSSEDSRMNNDKGNTGRDAYEGTITSGPLFPFSTMNSSGTTLKYFSATAAPNGVSIQWATASEWNNDFFTIERSTDGQVFTSIGKISGQGNTEEETSYQFHDDGPVPAKAYYRLMLTDLHEQTRTFPPIEVQTEKKGDIQSSLSVNPNPFSDHLMANCLVDDAGLVAVRLMDLSGKLYRNETAIVKTGTNAILLDHLDDIPSGVYLFTLTSASGKTSNQKVMK